MSHGNTCIHACYARKLPGKAQSLCALVARLRADGTTRERLEQARRAAHQLKGTAGAYGYAHVSQCAQRIEQALGAPDAPLDTIDWALLAHALRELAHAADNGSSGNG